MDILDFLDQNIFSNIANIFHIWVKIRINNEKEIHVENFIASLTNSATFARRNTERVKSPQVTLSHPKPVVGTRNTYLFSVPQSTFRPLNL